FDTDCSVDTAIRADQGGLAGRSKQDFSNTLGEFTQVTPGGRTGLAAIIGFDDAGANNSGIGPNDDIHGIYNVALNSDNLA
ncbi:MAG: hypothetical protein GTN99_09660, partial [Candidatus Dadabacteria bacterium]|nr:hypothetical protein [Candidatus Dadabacteria bacterium]